MSGAALRVGPTRLVRETGALVRRLAAGQRAAAVLSIAGAVSFAATIVVSAAVIGWITDGLILPRLSGDDSPLTLGRAATVLLAVAVWKSASIVLRRGAAAWWQLRSEQNLRARTVAHQLGLSLRWYASRSVGDLLSVSGNDTRQATRLLAPLPFAVGSLALLVGSMSLILTIDVTLGLLAGSVMLLVVLVDTTGSWLAFRRMEEVQSALGDVSKIAHESFDGALTVRALGREAAESERFEAASTQLRAAQVGLGRSWTGFRAVTDVAPTLGTVIVLTLGTLRAATGTVAPGQLVTVAYLLSLLVVPTRLIGYLVWDAARSLAGWRRVRTILDADDRPVHGHTQVVASTGGATITFEGVSFSYVPGHPVLRDVTMTIPAGRVVALVGPTGSGKSTVAALVARLWDPERGRVLLDGTDLRSLEPGFGPRTIAFVSQEPFLFDDTVAGNITLGDPEIGAPAVAAAVRIAQFAEVVAALPDGLATRIGERGATLSGGQQQRLGLARALARHPRLLVLDDATSAIDAEVEAEILAGLRRHRQESTVLLVASRPSTLLLSDEVIHLKDGRVREHGPHEDLLRRSAAYRALVSAYAEGTTTPGQVAR